MLQSLNPDCLILLFSSSSSYLFTFEALGKMNRLIKTKRAFVRVDKMCVVHGMSM